MSVLKNFKNTPRSPYGGRQDLDVIFFLQICNEVHGRKKMKGRPVATPHPRATGACRPPQRRQGPPPYIRALAAITLSFEPKNSGKKRGVRRRKAAKFCRIPHL